jgi:hypothetical protein
MSRVFSSRLQAAAFALLLASLLALPALVARTGWLDRRDLYPAIAWKFGPFTWIQQKIFVETNNADMVFLGSSHIWTAVDTPYVQTKLSEELGREAEVFTLGWGWPGFDASYIIARDLLDHRRVHTLVIYDEGNSDLPHLNSSRWFRIGENSEALSGLPWLAQARLYGGTVLGMPRQLLSLVRPNLLEDPGHSRPNIWNTLYRADNPAKHRGALLSRLAYNHSPDFVPFHPGGEATSADVLVYSAETHEAFKFTGPATQPYQLHFARRLARLCQERGTRLVVLHTPSLSERAQASISERELWPEVLGAPVVIVGIPPAKLFAGIPATDVPKLFLDDVHLNQNGQEMFTRLITPTLLKQYAASVNHD